MEKLKQYLKKMNMSQQDFALLAGIPNSTLSEVLSGVRAPSIPVMRKIKAATKGKITPNDLVL